MTYSNPSAVVQVPENDPIGTLYLSDIDFRAETLYFIIVDRFHDGNIHNLVGDPQLNDLAHQDWDKYWGGDLQGILDKMDYIQGMGISATWLTPLFEQIESLSENRAPIHGYWTRDFKRINARWVNDPSEVRLFERDDTIFDCLLAEMHRRGMKFVLDVVCNHSSPQSDRGKGRIYDDGRLVADFDHDVANWYHHYGATQNWEDEWQIQNCELEGLATFNENNILYRRYIKDALKMWIAKGVDALRVDTVKHMPLWFWQEITSDLKSNRPDLFIFGEWFGSHPDNATSVDFANRSGMSMLDFGLCHAIRACLGQNDPRGFEGVQAIYDKDGNYRNATELVTFFENHDMPRLQSIGADNESLRLAVILLLCGRGTPCLYYGCEQYLHNETEGGQDPYNRPAMESWSMETPIYTAIRVLARERRRNAAIQYGRQVPYILNADVYCFARVYRDHRCFVALNRGAEFCIPEVQTDFPDGTYFCLLSGRELTVKEGRIRQLTLGCKAACVISLCGVPVQGQVVIRAQVNGVVTKPGEVIAMIGDCPELGEWDIRKAFHLEYLNSTTWFGEIVLDESAGKSIAYKYVILSEADDSAPQRENRESRRRPIPSAGAVKWRDLWESI